MPIATIGKILPGLALSLAVALAAMAAQALEERLLGRPYLEALVLAILLGTAIRAIWTPSKFWRTGIAYSAKPLLEVAVVLLGASITLQTILAVGPALLIGIAAVVAVALAASYTMARALKLPQRIAILIACGNSICGNSAIVARTSQCGASLAPTSLSMV